VRVEAPLQREDADQRDVRHDAVLPAAVGQHL
jgi:hypothetical protein